MNTQLLNLLDDYKKVLGTDFGEFSAIHGKHTLEFKTILPLRHVIYDVISDGENHCGGGERDQVRYEIRGKVLKFICDIKSNSASIAWFGISRHKRELARDK